MLSKQNLTLNFADGMDTKTDTKQLPLGKFYKLTNGVYTSPFSLKKRNGYSSINLSTTTSASVTNLKSLSRLNNQLLSLTDNNLFSYSKNAEKWIDRGHISNVGIEATSIIRNNATQSKLSVASNFGISAYTWKDSRGGCRLSVIDNNNKTVFLHDVELTSTGDNPKVVVNGNVFYFVFTDGTDLKFKKVNSANPTSLSSEQVAAANLDNVNPVFDINTANNRVYVAYNSTVVGSELQLFFIDQSDTVSIIVGVLGATPTTTINLYIDKNSRIVITFYDGTNVQVVIYNFTLTGQLLGLTTIETVANVVNVDAISPSLNNLNILYTISAASPYNYLVRKNTTTYAGAVGTPSVLLRSVSQASKQIKYNNDTYSVVLHQSTLQATYFLVNSVGQVEVKIAPAVAGEFVPNNALSQLPVLNDSTFLLASQIKAESSSDQGTFFSTLGVNSTTINFAPALNYQDEVLGQNLYITGGILRNYDGVNVTEDGFFLFPENFVAGTNAAAGGSLTDGTRQYVVVYAWYDNKGQLHRSTTSIPLTTTQAAGGATQTQELTIPTLRLTYKTNVIIEVYRTEDLGQLFYKVSSTTAPLINDTTVDTVNFVDTISDAALISRELIYVTGGILDNDQAPNASYIVNWKNRLVLAGLENSQEVAFSKLITTGEPAQFSDFFRFNVNDDVGPITAIAVLDDKLIIFKQASMFALSGNGPNNAGEQDDYGTPDRISSDVGCVDFNSIVITPSGIMFKSEKGIYLLNRGLSAQYIGYEVEEYNDATINSGVLVPNTNQIRFLTDANVALVFDYFLEKWSIFDNHGGKDAEVIDNNYIYLRNDDTIMEETENLYLDNGEYISLQIDTGWLSFAGVQGFQRVYKMLALGEYKTPHKMRIQAAYNFVDAFIHEKVIDTSEFMNQTTYGSQSPYGSEALYGTPQFYNTYQLRLDMKVQKTQSLRLQFKELQNDTYGEGLSLSNLSFEVGAKIGQFQVNKSQTFGAK